MPCLDEAETLGVCIEKAWDYLRRSGTSGEILIADNGSSDGSREIARDLGARVIDVPTRGYGAALLGGIGAARGRYVIMGDADDSYDFSDLDAFVTRLRAGDDLVMGNRFLGGIEPGAMPALHRYLGNPVLTGIGRLFFECPARDFHCGLRGFSKAAIESLDLRTTGMEFASEMVVKASLRGLRISEVPTILSPDGRSRAPHLRSWRDGWRHLRFLLMYCPRWLFLYPGLALLVAGLAGMALLMRGPLAVGGVHFDVNTLILAAAAIMMGSQALTFAWLSTQFAINQGLLPEAPTFHAARRFLTLERAVLCGAVLMVSGGAGIVVSVAIWGAVGFGDLDHGRMMRLTIPSVTAIGVGFQLILTGFLSSILDLETRRED